ncbi:MAG: LptE family protein [Planctomycetes bacterium]|nr:LptE family protein [Planctomycetota bacterium]
MNRKPLFRLKTGRCGRLTPTVIARIIALVALPTVTAFPGCGYVVGNGFPAEVRSVYVPVFQSDSFRRGIELQLTEAVQKEIQKRTPFRLVDRPWADTELTGRIVDVRKDVLGETANDDPRELQLSLAVEVTWRDLRTGRVLAQQQVPLEPSTVQLIAHSQFSPEIGQSYATAMQQAVDGLARRIVNMMETPW